MYLNCLAYSNEILSRDLNSIKVSLSTQYKILILIKNNILYAYCGKNNVNVCLKNFWNTRNDFFFKYFLCILIIFFPFYSVIGYYT